jgi:hypothetical protein
MRLDENIMPAERTAVAAAPPKPNGNGKANGNGTGNGNGNGRALYPPADVTRLVSPKNLAQATALPRLAAGGMAAPKARALKMAPDTTSH